MFKDLLIKWVTDLIDKFAAVGQNSYLSIGLSAFNNTLYGWVHTIMTKAQVVKLLAKGKTDLIKGFTSKAGKPFDANLVLKEDKTVGFDFPPRK